MFTSYLILTDLFKEGFLLLLLLFLGLLVFVLFCFLLSFVSFFQLKISLDSRPNSYIYVVDSLELVSIQVTPPTRPQSSLDPLSVNRTNSWCFKTLLNANVQCSVTAICWRGVDITIWTTAHTSRQNNKVTLVWKTKAFSEEMKNKFLHKPHPSSTPKNKFLHCKSWRTVENSFMAGFQALNIVKKWGYQLLTSSSW